MLTLILFALVAVRFVRRAFQEARRQRVLTWPRAVAQLPEGEDRLPGLSTDRFGETTFYRAELVKPYTFYARGQRYTGKRLAPRLQRLNAEEQHLFLRELAKQRKYEVFFNPDDPTDNYLTVGTPLLTYGKLFFYLTYGLGIPLGLVYLFVSGALLEERLLTLSLVLLIPVLILPGVVLLSLPILNVGGLLIPAHTADTVDDADTDDGLLRSLAGPGMSDALRGERIVERVERET